MKLHRLFGGVVLLGSLAVLGCGGVAQPPSGTVTGTVTFKGQPVTAGQVSFSGPENRSATATINPDGTYKVEAPLGENKVAVMTPAKPSAGGGNMSMGGPQAVAVPGKYGSPTSSGLSVTVNKGTQTYDIPLQ